VLGVRPARREAQVTFDWFKSYEDVAHLLRPLLPNKTARILILGCGNSTLSEDVCVLVSLLSTSLSEHALNITQMYDDGYKNIVNVDVRSCPDCCRLSMWSLMAFSHTQYSAVVIEQMAARNHNRPEMQCTFFSLSHISKS
jgi:EEF1A lysine methyltransferase 4